MKKPWQYWLFTVTMVFLAFTAGLFLGRNHSRGAVTVSVPSAMLSALPQTEPAEKATQSTQSVQFPLNINSASAEDLQVLPGIGEVLARRIIAYREENGGFSRVEELMYVEGIGEKRLEEMLEYITIGDNE